MTDKYPTTGCWPENIPGLDKAELQQLTDRILPVFKSLLVQEKIPESEAFNESVKCLYIPLSAWLTCQQKDAPLIIGINGSQGSGKSTLTRILVAILELGFNKKVVSFSIDDLYLSRDQRTELARDVHPLFRTRGVPGTHDIELGISILNQLLQRKSAEIKIPVFDKSIDDRLPESEWNRVHGICDIVIFEGWCVGSIAQGRQALESPINGLEKAEDKDGVWRKYVNQQLEGVYAELFSLIDIMLMLKIPDFEKVYEWRKLQEQKLKASLADNPAMTDNTMSESEIERFIMYFERITRHTLDEMPARADVVMELGEDHRVRNVIVKGKA
ncbi:MAG: hypothetical protein OQL09_09105 [Gammaproteobacteria bacterium]|nr:hypothetical protein [Gammaproteobacteria bacterium]